MHTRRVGRSGLTVSRLALGTLTWGLGVDQEGARDQLEAFVAAGGTVVDTAASYGDGAAESWLGRLIGAVVPRDGLVIVTKSGVRPGPAGRVVDVSRRALVADLDASLRRLGTDHVDVWLVQAWSDDVPLAETMGALEYAVSSGRARYVGVANYGGWQAARAYSLLETARIPLLCNEVEISLVAREAEYEILPAAQSLGFGVLAWAPLGHGVLTGKYRNGVPPDSRGASLAFPRSVQRYLDARSAPVVDAVVTAARGLGVPPSQVALAWVRDLAGVSAAVVGARTVAQVQAAVAAEALTLPMEIRAALDDVSR